MKGAFVNMKQHDNGSPEAPQDYIDDSLKMISKAGLDHARFLFYWEAFERDPKAFMKEIESVAKAGDKYGVKIIYDNHQWHTSSWLEDKGTGFPWSLFEDSKYSKGGGGNTPDKGAQVFWKDWWDRSVKDNEGKDGWTLMAEYLKKIVLAVDNHSSTLGYEILSEPHVDNTDQWSKIGKFNSFITEELRDITSKTIVYSMNVPVDLNSNINISPQNLAKMAPSSKQNTAFKISVYGVPDRDDYQKERFDLFLDTRDLTGVPLYIGEWNNVVRTKEGGVFKINPGASDFTNSNAGKILEAFKKEGVWGTAFWKWDYRDADTASFNLVNDESGKLVPTKYFGILEDTVEKVYGSFDSVSTSDVSASGNTSIGGGDDTATSDVSASGNTSTGGGDGKETNLINKLVKTGKFTEAEAKQFVSKSMQNVPDVTSTSDNTQSSNTQSSNTQSSNTQSSNNQTNNNDQPSNANTNNPEKYENLDDLVDDIKNHVVDIEDISLNAFQDSGAYQEADQETQDCIDLAGKIGDNLADQEIVNCSEDPNFYRNEISNTDNNDDNN